MNETLDALAKKCNLERRIDEPDNYLWARIELTDEYERIKNAMEDVKLDLLESFKDIDTVEQNRLKRIADFERELGNL